MVVTNLRQMMATLLISHRCRRRQKETKNCCRIRVRSTFNDKNIHGAFKTTLLKIKDLSYMTGMFLIFSAHFLPGLHHSRRPFLNFSFMIYISLVLMRLALIQY